MSIKYILASDEKLDKRVKPSWKGYTLHTQKGQFLPFCNNKLSTQVNTKQVATLPGGDRIEERKITIGDYDIITRFQLNTLKAGLLITFKNRETYFRVSTYDLHNGF